MPEKAPLWERLLAEGFLVGSAGGNKVNSSKPPNNKPDSNSNKRSAKNISVRSAPAWTRRAIV
jgi:hypothetical protein